MGVRCDLQIGLINLLAVLLSILGIAWVRIEGDLVGDKRRLIESEMRATQSEMNSSIKQLISAARQSPAQVDDLICLSLACAMKGSK